MPTASVVVAALLVHGRLLLVALVAALVGVPWRLLLVAPVAALVVVAALRVGALVGCTPLFPLCLLLLTFPLCLLLLVSAFAALCRSAHL